MVNNECRGTKQPFPAFPYDANARIACIGPCPLAKYNVEYGCIFNLNGQYGMLLFGT